MKRELEVQIPQLVLPNVLSQSPLTFQPTTPLTLLYTAPYGDSTLSFITLSLSGTPGYLLAPFFQYVS